MSRSGFERHHLVLASGLVGCTMLVIGRRFLVDGTPVIKVRLGKETHQTHLIFKAGKATNAQLDQVKILPSWAKLVEVEGANHRYHKFIWADTIGWKCKTCSFSVSDGADILKGTFQ